MNSLAILVLAAGKSSRMKAIKQLLKINNKTLLEITLETAKNINPENVFCVLGANAEKIKKETNIKNMNYIFNENFEEGLSSSIVYGVNYIQKKHSNLNSILILLSDQPEINPKYLNSLINLSLQNPQKIIASNYSQKPGVPAVFPKKYFNQLLLLKGDKGAQKFLKNHTSEIIKIEREKPLKDIDTQEDYLSYINSI
ncbi:NTP transferase domain-containing protein [Polaribacter sp. Hel1_85]|uniref:nucleotidyltransferase family protein n=1 Tax=Polaribacter sp. Hel1_85 TaxID=1250005 RepID=UPI00052D3A94|nr:nucleotidyltransferase family protein [Polaribacter sp. Hel1_85]KGL61939.1 MobA-like protein [Polaribacter sp. Hel1_85]